MSFSALGMMSPRNILIYWDVIYVYRKFLLVMQISLIAKHLTNDEKYFS